MTGAPPRPQVAKEPLLSVGNKVLPTVPIVPQHVSGDAPTSGAWGSGGAPAADGSCRGARAAIYGCTPFPLAVGAADPLASGGSRQPTQPFAPQCAGSASLGSAPTAGGQGAHDPLLRSAAGGGGTAAPQTAAAGPGSISSSLQHATNDPSLVHGTAGAPTTPFVAQPASGAVGDASALSGMTARDQLAAGATGVPTTVLMPQSVAAGGGAGPPPGAAPGSTSLSMSMQQAMVPTTVQMPLNAANAGEGLPETFWRASPDGRAKQVIDHAVSAAGPKIFAVAPSDLTEPRPRMQQCFVASVVDALGGGGEEGELDTYEEETNDSAEARVFKNWAASLGLKLNMKDLFSDSCSGIVLLKVMERLQPGAVDWDRVKGTPKNKYEKVGNCNYAIKVAKELGLKLTGISGQDIAEGNEKRARDRSTPNHPLPRR